MLEGPYIYMIKNGHIFFSNAYNLNMDILMRMWVTYFTHSQSGVCMIWANELT